jgi:hypothetical protein
VDADGGQCPGGLDSEKRAHAPAGMTQRITRQARSSSLTCLMTRIAGETFRAL